MDEVLADENIVKIGANLKFDLMWFIHHSGISKVRNIHDVMIESQLTHRYRTFDGVAKAFPNLRSPKATLASPYWEGNDLASIIKQTVGVEIKKGRDDNPFKIYHEDEWRYEYQSVPYTDKNGKERKKREKVPVELLHKAVDWLGPWTPEMEEYMLEDIDYLEPAHEELERRLAAEGQERVAWIENNTVFATAWMTYNGVAPDVPEWKRHLKRQIKQHGKLLKKLQRLFPSVENFNSNPQVKAAVSAYVGSPISSIDKAHLKTLAPHYKKIRVLQDERKLQTRIRNWGPSFLEEFVCKICRRFHPDWRQIGAETARYSCSKPNLQQIPRETDYRRLFIAASDCHLVSLDYSAIEVVTAAVFARCPALLEACKTGNPHGATAAMTMGLSMEDWLALDDKVKQDTRQNAKIVNFGLLFGGGKSGLIEQALSLFDVTLSDEQAESMIRKFYELFPELRYSKNWAYRAFDRTGPVKVTTLVGYVRWLEGFNRKATNWLNTTIQSSAGHGIKSSFRHIMEAGLLPFLCMQIHDELVFEFPDSNPYNDETPYDLMKIAERCMLRGMQEVLGKDAPIRIEGKAGSWWQ